MALPIPPNVTCVLYRHDHDPPADPDLGPVNGYLQGVFDRAFQPESGSSYSHLLLLDVAVDVRDAYDEGRFGLTADKVIIPDAAGVKYRVRYVERQGRGTPQDHKRVYLDRMATTWPTNDV